MTQPGWLCTCGHWQEDDFHCALCGEHPPGCDCDTCNEPYGDDEIFYDDDEEEDYDDDEEREDE